MQSLTISDGGYVRGYMVMTSNKTGYPEWNNENEFKNKINTMYSGLIIACSAI